MSSRPDEHVAQLPWWRRDLTARQVRILSVVVLITMLAGFGAPIVAPSAGFLIFVWLNGAVLILASHIAGNFPGWRAAMPGELDERQLAERGMVLRVSYGVMGICLMLLYSWGLYSADWPKFGQNVTIDGWLLFCLFHMHIMLPGSILAWRDTGSEAEE